MSKHDWYICFPGNYCKECGCDDPAEVCVGNCNGPYEENGLPNPNKCPIHGPEFSPGLYECPPDLSRLSPEAIKFYNIPLDS